MSASKPQFKKLLTFISFYRPYKLLFTLDLLCASLTSVTGLAIPLCIRAITQAALGPGASGPWSVIGTPLLVMLGLIAVQTAAGVFYDYKGHAMGALIERDMRNDLFNHVQRLPLAFFDTHKTGAIMSRISNDLLTIAEVCHHAPEDILISVVRFAGAFIVLWGISARLTLAVFALLPLMVLYTLFFQGKLRRVYRENRETIGELNAGLEDTISGIRVVKSFANENLESARFGAANQRFYHSRAAIYKSEACYYSVMDHFFMPLVSAGAIAAGGLLIAGSRLAVADLIVFLLYTGYLTAPLTRIASMVGLIQDGIAGFNRFIGLKDTPAEAPPAPAPAPQRLRGRVEFVNTSFRYGEGTEPVLEGVSLVIEPGETVALVGASGAGKTTLSALMSRLYDASGGTILIDGIDTRSLDLYTLRRNIGVIAQDVYLFAGTVYENIAYGKPGASGHEVIAAAKKADAHDFIAALPNAYSTRIGPRGIRLSGGQRQRIAIARAFLKDAPILILDEATSALDAGTEETIRESLKTIMAKRSVLVISHRASTIQMAKRVYTLENRRVRETQG